MAEFRKNTGQTTSEGGSCDETTAKKGHQSLQKAITKKVVNVTIRLYAGGQVRLRQTVQSAMITTTACHSGQQQQSLARGNSCQIQRRCPIDVAYLARTAAVF